MINKRTLFAILIAGALAQTSYGQNGLLGAVGAYCRDGWKFSASYVLEPWPSSSSPQVSIKGHTTVVHTDANSGKPDIFHRIFVDPSAKTYWGYDVEVEPIGETGTAKLRFKALSLRANQLPRDYHALQVGNAADFQPLPAPQVPAGTFDSGQIIAVDVLKNLATGQKVIDYIEVGYEAVYRSNKAEAKEFQVSDVLLHVFVPSLNLNGENILPDTRLADRMLNSPLVWLSLPGRGRFLLSLCPRAGYGFEKAGVVDATDLSFSWAGNRYDLHSGRQVTETTGNWALYVLASTPAPPDALGQKFSYGEVRSVEEFLSKAQ